MDAVKTTYKGIDIEYHERTDRWVFEFEGKEHKAESLANAKATIDAPPKPKRKPFERFSAWTRKLYSNEFRKVTVTSFIDSDYGRIRRAWTTDEKGEREQISLDELYADTPENQQLISDWIVLKGEIDALDGKANTLVSRMENIEVPKEIA